MNGKKTQHSDEVFKKILISAWINRRNAFKNLAQKEGKWGSAIRKDVFSWNCSTCTFYYMFSDTLVWIPVLVGVHTNVLNTYNNKINVFIEEGLVSGIKNLWA